MRRLLMAVKTKYKRFEYIQSNGNQYFDTGYKASYKTKIDIKFSDISYNWVCGSEETSDNYSNFGICYNMSMFGSQGIGYSSLTTGTHIINYGKTLIVDNVQKGTFSTQSATSDVSLALFGIKKGDNTFKSLISGKIYYCRIYDDNILVRNFIPILRKSDNEIGMLDLVEGKFYGNAGTGKFTANLDLKET